MTKYFLTFSQILVIKNSREIEEKNVTLKMAELKRKLN